MHTAVPTISAVALPNVSVQPAAAKIRLVPSSVAIVIPDVGLEVTPTRPTMRELTVTKKKAKRTTRAAAMARPQVNSMELNAWGTRVRTRKMIPAPMPTVRRDRSCSVRRIFSAASPAAIRSRIWAAPILKLSIMVGMLRISVISPPVATAPAPM